MDSRQDSRRLGERAVAVRDNLGTISTGDNYLSIDISKLSAAEKEAYLERLSSLSGFRIPGSPPDDSIEARSKKTARKLFQALLALDFVQHHKTFDERAIKQNPSACLVQNQIDPQYPDEQFFGETILLHRLSRRLQSYTGKPVLHELISRSGINQTGDNLWRLLGQRVGVTILLSLSESDKKEIANKVAARLASHHVILVLAIPASKNFLGEELLPFWRDLVLAVRDSAEEGSGHLLLFLFDKNNITADPPAEIILLPPIAPFPRQDLMDWYMEKGPDLPLPEKKGAADFIEDLFKQSSGIPLFVVNYLCKLCVSQNQDIKENFVHEALLQELNNEGRMGA